MQMVGALLVLLLWLFRDCVVMANTESNEKQGQKGFWSASVSRKAIRDCSSALRRSTIQVLM